MEKVDDPTDLDLVKRRVDDVRDRIASACRRASRSVDDVTLIGVTKTFPVAAVHAARAAGLTRFGENRVQDLVEKIEAVPGRLRGGDVEWHMIGHLQRNKAKDVVDYADFFQALDSPRLARELNKRGRREDRVVPCLVQVNISGEESKYGIRPADTHDFLDQIGRFDYLRVEGLMAIATYSEDSDVVRPEFRRMRELFETYVPKNGSGIVMEKLSMGMSNDFEPAVEEGATHVRIGSAIFGERDY
ncbi:MAG: YggS family pyridoxal phosphate-dependent enzyme [Rhodothermales bacterium]